MKTAEAPIHFPTHHTLASDGTRLRYFDTEEPLPAIVLANGLGGPAAAWGPYLHLWKGKYRLLAWDYRGLYGSTLSTRQADLSVHAHVSDLHAILEAAQIPTAALFGWSMGVQVGLEFYSQYPNRVSHLALINGTCGRPLGAVPLPLAGLALPRLLTGARRFHRLGEGLVHRFTNSALSYPVMLKLGILAPSFSRAFYEELISEFNGVDMDVYLELLAQLHEHDAEHLLATVRAPTLVMAGTKDWITPPWLARKMASQVPGAELYVIHGGTHYCAAEYPELVAARTEQFLASRAAS